MLGKKLHLCCTGLKNHHNHRQDRQSPSFQNALTNPQNALHIPKHFNSLYHPSSDDGDDDDESLTGFGSGSTSRTLTTLTTTNDDDAATDSEPDLSTVFASRRLIRPASTGRSNSIVEEGNNRVGVAGFGAVPKMSPDPYGDFKRSMEEMVEAMGLSCADTGEVGEEQSRMRMQELLLCYLALNRKNAHGYIVGAFADVLKGLSASSAVNGN